MTTVFDRTVDVIREQSETDWTPEGIARRLAEEGLLILDEQPDEDEPALDRSAAMTNDQRRFIDSARELLDTYDNSGTDEVPDLAYLMADMLRQAVDFMTGEWS